MPDTNVRVSAVTLYETQDTLFALSDSYDLCDTDEARAECKAEIERAIIQQLRKVDSFCQFLAHLESQTELAAAEIHRIEARSRQIWRTQKRLEEYAIRTMQTWNLRVLDGDTSQLRLRDNPPAVEIIDEPLIPGEYRHRVETFTIDKRLIKRAIDEGTPVPGAQLRTGVRLVRK